jgi:hypothetical protein
LTSKKLILGAHDTDVGALINGWASRVLELQEEATSGTPEDDSRAWGLAALDGSYSHRGIWQQEFNAAGEGTRSVAVDAIDRLLLSFSVALAEPPFAWLLPRLQSTVDTAIELWWNFIPSRGPNFDEYERTLREG